MKNEKIAQAIYQKKTGERVVIRASDSYEQVRKSLPEEVINVALARYALHESSLDMHVSVVQMIVIGLSHSNIIQSDILFKEDRV